MELRHLKYFRVLAEELHFGKAAERLFIAQPPLSRQIKQLENELGVVLFQRNNRKVTLTEEGQYLVKQAEQLFLQVQNTKENIRLISKGLAGQVTIGYVGATMHSILPDLLLKSKQSYPQVKTILLELSNEDQIKGIKSGNIDIGFVRTPININGIVTNSVLKEKFCLVLPNHFKIKQGKKHPLAALANEPFISFARDCGPGLVDSAMRICNGIGFSPKVVHESTQINTMLRLVEIGLGYTIVPKSVKCGYELKLNFIDLDEFDEWAVLSMIYSENITKAIVSNFIAIAEGKTAVNFS